MATIRRLAGPQHGIVTRAQLLAAGISSSAIGRLVERGVLIQVHRGVYRVGHTAPSTESDYLAAVRACGGPALLSGPAATHLYGLIKGPPPPPEVTCLTRRRIPGVRTRRTRQIADATEYRGIPITAIPRTLVDLAGVLEEDPLARAVHEAEVRFRVRPERVEAVLSRRPNSPGAAKLRAVLRGDVHVTLSELERRFLALLREDGLPLPVTNPPAGTRRVDCRWPEHRLTVELDGYRYHSSRHAWEQDRRREREAHARGDDLRRFTWGDLFEHPDTTLRELRDLLPTQPVLG